MKFVMKAILPLALIAVICISYGCSNGGGGGSKKFTNEDILWSVSDLQNMITDGTADNVVIIDLRQEKQFDNGAFYYEYDGISASSSDNPGHIPGAVKFSWLEFHEGNNKTKGAKPWSERAAALGNIGVLKNSKILLTSDVKLPCN